MKRTSSGPHNINLFYGGDGWWVAEIVGTGTMSQGRTPQAALRNLADAYEMVEAVTDGR